MPALIAMIAAILTGACTHDRVRARIHRRSMLITGAPAITPAREVLAGDWIVRPTAPDDDRWPAPDTESAAITHHRAARVMQIVRLGGTDQVRLTTTAGILVLPDFAPVGVVEMAGSAG